MLGLNPCINSTLSCYEGIVASYLKWIGYTYVMIFENSWGLHFYENIDFNKPDPLEKYYGIRIKGFGKYLNLGDIHRLIYIDRVPLIVFTNIYDCPWTKAYRKCCSDHILLALGIEDDNLLCIDPYFSNNIHHFDSNNVMAEQVVYATFEKLSENQSENPRFLCDELKNQICFYHNTNIFSYIELKNNLNILDIDTETVSKKEFNALELTFDKNLFLLDRITKNRLNYIEMLKHINSLNCTYDFHEFTGILKKLSMRWSACRIKLLKYYISKNNDDHEEFRSMFILLLESEQQLCKNFYEYFL